MKIKFNSAKQILSEGLINEGLEDIGLPSRTVEAIRMELSGFPQNDSVSLSRVETWIGNYIKKHFYSRDQNLTNIDEIYKRIQLGIDKIVPLDNSIESSSVELEQTQILTALLDLKNENQLVKSTSINSDQPSLYKKAKKIAKRIIGFYEKYIWKIVSSTEEGRWKDKIPEIENRFYEYIFQNLPDYYYIRDKESLKNSIIQNLTITPMSYMVYDIRRIIQILKQSPSFFDVLQERYQTTDKTPLQFPTEIRELYETKFFSFDEDKVMKRYPNGLYWYDTGVQTCSIEARELNNCGDEQFEGHLYSLRYLKPGLAEDARPVWVALVEYNPNTKVVLQIKGKRFEDGAVYGNRAPYHYLRPGEYGKNYIHEPIDVWDAIADFIDFTGAVAITEEGQYVREPYGIDPMNEMLMYLERETGLSAGASRSKKQEELLNEAEELISDAFSRLGALASHHYDYDLGDVDEIDIDEGAEDVEVSSGRVDFRFRMQFDDIQYGVYQNNEEEIGSTIESKLHEYDNTSFPIEFRLDSSYEWNSGTQVEIGVRFDFDESVVQDYLKFMDQTDQFYDSIVNNESQIIEEIIDSLKEDEILGPSVAELERQIDSEPSRYINLELSTVEDTKIIAEFRWALPFLLFSYDSDKLPVASLNSIFKEARERTYEGFNDLVRSMYDDFIASQSQLGLFDRGRRSTAETFPEDARVVRSSLLGMETSIPFKPEFKRGKEEMYLDQPIDLIIDRDILADAEQTTICSNFLSFLGKNKVNYLLNQIKKLYNENLEQVLKNIPSYEGENEEINESFKRRKISLKIKRTQ